MLLGFVILYMVFTVAMGFFASRFISSSTDFVQAGRRLPAFFNATALFALWFGSETVFGASSRFMEEGLIGVVEDPFGGVLCLLLFAIFFVRKLYRLNMLTIGDLFERAYGKRVEVVSSVFMLITFFGYIAAQLIALAIILKSVTGLETEYGIVLCAVIVTGYTFVGGMWAVSITDFVQSIFIVIGMIIIAVYMANAAGGVDVIFNSAPEGTFTFLPERDPLGWSNWIALWLTLGLGSLASQDIFQRVNSARSEKAAVRSTYIGALMYLIISMFPLFIALSAKVLYPNENFSDTQEVIPRLVLAHAPMVVQVLFFGSLLSAVLSTCSGALLAPASILSENLIKPLSKREYSDQQFLWLVRISIVIMAIISTVIALGGSDIFELVSVSSVLGIVSLLVPMVAALYWKKANAAGAMLSMFSGMGTWLILEYMLHPKLEPFLIALPFSILGLVLGTYLFPVKIAQD
ncbi:MAG TPA: sodium:solute symporter family protein [Flavobacteriales bacterium]|nr:sodium:solute symporter family protein [Flavobacteriales bacterium]HRJ36926.1 sodium:solute symporter family protein [Flavobacteriales bacterium]HRJ37671.1 sodium:solute symporter family protein [Flavobacteriales bacterium]